MWAVETIDGDGTIWGTGETIEDAVNDAIPQIIGSILDSGVDFARTDGDIGPPENKFARQLTGSVGRFYEVVAR